MKTKYVIINPEIIDKNKIKEAAEIIQRGGLVAFPTETVYGLGGDAKNPQASHDIYAAKGRPSDNPLIVHIAELSQLEEICDNVPATAYALADAFWPGPLTMIVKKNHLIPLETTGGLSTVAVRFPSHPIAQALILESGCMIAAPSANTSGRPSPTKATHVREDLDGAIDMILDGGAVSIGIESTIVDLTGEQPMILRPGYISKEAMEEVVGTVLLDPTLLAGKDMAGIAPKAPGMKYKHYAPKADLTIVDGAKEDVIATINALSVAGQQHLEKVAVLATEETKDFYQADIVFDMGSRDREEEIAQKLYDVLRQCDDQKVSLIYSESFETPRMGQAIMNRLLKAAGHHRIDAQKGEAYGSGN